MKKVLSIVLTLCLLINYLTLNVIAETTGVTGFVTRLYQQCLSREPDQSGLAYWVNGLNTKAYTGAAASESFIFSNEFVAKNVSDDQFLTIMYTTFFNREPDSPGKAYWASLLNSGYSKRFVLASFANSDEFKNICSTYGIIPGNIALSNVEIYPKITAFVQRFYLKCLGRMPDVGGLKYWVDVLVSKNSTAAALADGFTSGPEFISKNLSNADFTAVLYRVFFDREPDQSGQDYWVNLLANGYSRRFVLAGFVASQEFKNLCGSFGIDSGFIKGDMPAVKVTSLSLNKTSADVALSGTDTLTASVAPADATNNSVTWQSSDNNVATVVNGLVKGVGIGTAVITAVTEDGNKTAQCSVNVIAIITKVNYITDINVANSTDLAKVGLPANVEVTLNGSVTKTLAVTWDNGTPVYNKSMKGTYVFSGKFTLPFNVTNPYDSTAFVNVNIADPAVTTVEAVPVINVANGTTLDTLKAALPASLKINVNNGTSPTVNVTWDTTNYIGNASDAAVCTLYGTLTLPAGVINPGNVKASVNVNVAKPTITAADAIADITVETGTTIDKAGLPAAAAVTLSNGTKATLSVAWDGGTPLYNGNTVNTYTFSGTLALPANITNPNSKKAAVKISVVQPSIKSVNLIPNINAAIGTAINNVGLPKTVTITLSNGTTAVVNVTWDGGSPAYNGNTANSYVFTGMLTLPAGVTNPNNLKASAKVNVGKTKPAAKLLFTFDDGFKDQLTIAAPILSAKGFKGTAYVIQAGALGLWGTDYMTTSEINSLYKNYGWDIGNHTVNHPHGTATDAATLATLKTEYLTNQNWILSNGWTRGAYHAAYPYGEYSTQLISSLKTIGLLSSRTVNSGIQTTPVSDFYQLTCIDVIGATVSNLKSRIDAAVSGGSTVIFMIHKVEAVGNAADLVMASGDFQQIVDYASQYAQQDKLDVTTISDWYNSVK